MSMKITTDHIQGALQYFGITGKVIGLKPFIEVYPGAGSSQGKIILRANLEDGKVFVVKLTCEPQHSKIIVEAQSVFSELLRNNGIITPERYKTPGGYVTSMQIENVSFNVTVEDFLSDEPKYITKPLARDIGGLMARTHIISLENRACIGRGTIFCAIDPNNDVTGYDVFLKLCQSGNCEEKLFSEIIRIYSARMEYLKAVWDTLPRSAVQGDISINNLSITRKGLGLFDYNISGDEVLISDMVLEGLLTAYEMDLPPNLMDMDRHELWRAFSEGYLSVRPLTASEQNVLNDIYAVADAMWFTKILYSENSLFELSKRGDSDGIYKIMKNMLNILENNDCI